jgi:hypothetical protein
MQSPIPHRKIFNNDVLVFESFNHNEYQKLSPFLHQNERLEIDRKVHEMMKEIRRMPNKFVEEKMIPLRQQSQRRKKSSERSKNS